MGKRGSSSADAKTLAAVQASLKEKAEAEKARLAMDPPPPPKKKSKKRSCRTFGASEPFFVIYTFACGAT